MHCDALGTATAVLMLTRMGMYSVFEVLLPIPPAKVVTVGVFRGGWCHYTALDRSADHPNAPCNSW